MLSMSGDINDRADQTDQSIGMPLTGDEFSMSDFKMDFNVTSNSSSPSLLSQRADFQSPSVKPFVKQEEPTEVVTSLSPLSPSSSGLGSSLHSQSPQTTNNYFASMRAGQPTMTGAGGMGVFAATRGDPIPAAASLNIKNEAFSPQSMDICN